MSDKIDSIPPDMGEGLTRPDRADILQPAAYLHTLWMELGQFETILSGSEDSPFGVPGRDHSKCYPVTCEPLFRKQKISKPKVKV